jgi:hypothetical protein
MTKKPRYLVKDNYSADPLVHVFNCVIYIYPSYVVDAEIPKNDLRDHFNMRNYPGSYSIDPAVLENGSYDYYLCFGGLWGDQLQRYHDDKAIECRHEPTDNEPALCARVSRLTADMPEFSEEPLAIVMLDENGQPIKAGDHDRRYFEDPWMHKYNEKYYFSYSTGNIHFLCYSFGDYPYGPFTCKGQIVNPVEGRTTHPSIWEFKGKWYLFYDDSVPSGGKTWLRSIKMIELEYNPDGSIVTIDGILLY